MNTISDKVGNEMRADLAAIRSAVGKLPGARLPWDPKNPVDLVNQGDCLLQCYENWLLDDEQKQMLDEQPEARFILLESNALILKSIERSNIANDPCSSHLRN